MCIRDRLDSYQLVAFLEVHGDQAGFSVGIEVGKGGLLDGSVLGDSDRCV